MKRLLILRGIPGSGKSTYAKSFAKATVMSADDYFLTPEGQYVYRPEKLQTAHELCYLRFVKAVINNDEIIIIDNMNIDAWHISPYYMLGEVFDYAVEIVNFLTDIETSYQRNIHNVPKQDIESAAERIRTTKLPKHWTQVSAKNR